MFIFFIYLNLAATYKISVYFRYRPSSLLKMLICMNGETSCDIFTETKLLHQLWLLSFLLMSFPHHHFSPSSPTSSLLSLVMGSFPYFLAASSHQAAKIGTSVFADLWVISEKKYARKLNFQWNVISCIRKHSGCVSKNDH